MVKTRMVFIVEEQHGESAIDQGERIGVFSDN